MAKGSSLDIEVVQIPAKTQVIGNAHILYVIDLGMVPQLKQVTHSSRELVVSMGIAKSLAD